MKVRVPDSIKIGGYKYRIILDSSNRLLDEAVQGEVNHRKLEIRVHSSRPNSQRRESLIHEILHCVDKIYGNGGLEEQTVHLLAEGLNQAFDELGIEFQWGRK